MLARNRSNGNEEEERGNDGVEQVLDLGFGTCKLQVQVPENGKIEGVEGLVGKDVVTSFVGLTEQYFRRLEEGEKEERAVELVKGDVGKDMGKKKRKLRTRIKYVGGSVEAACALGVADGIVDLVGMLVTSLQLVSKSHHDEDNYHGNSRAADENHVYRIRRDNESSRSQGHRHSRPQHSRPHQVETTVKTRTRRINRQSNQRRYQCVPSSCIPYSSQTFPCSKERPPPLSYSCTNIYLSPPRLNPITPLPYRRPKKNPPSTNPIKIPNSVKKTAAQKYILCQYNVPRHLLTRATTITPGKRAPTLTALEDPDWVAVSSMVEKARVADAMDQLTVVGAADILCLSISNSRTG